jgi:hypothetical protein
MIPGLLVGQTTNQPNAYHVISERNAFGLRAPLPSSPAHPVEAEPLEDLVLTGLIEMPACRQALFALFEPGQPPSLFALREGEQNKWLEVKSVNSVEGTAKIVLKKPVARLRNVGEEVVLSFRSDGKQNRSVALNRGNPHVDIPADPPRQ